VVVPHNDLAVCLLDHTSTVIFPSTTTILAVKEDTAVNEPLLCAQNATTSLFSSDVGQYYAGIILQSIMMPDPRRAGSV
jgi:hypothetical protein